MKRIGEFHPICSSPPGRDTRIGMTIAQRLRRIDEIEAGIERSWRRPYSVLWGSAKLKEVVVASAMDGAITTAEAADIIDQYGLREV